MGCFVFVFCMEYFHSANFEGRRWKHLRYHFQSTLLRVRPRASDHKNASHAYARRDYSLVSIRMLLAPPTPGVWYLGRREMHLHFVMWPQFYFDSHAYRTHSFLRTFLQFCMYFFACLFVYFCFAFLILFVCTYAFISSYISHILHTHKALGPVSLGSIQMLTMTVSAHPSGRVTRWSFLVDVECRLKWLVVAWKSFQATWPFF